MEASFFHTPGYTYNQKSLLARAASTNGGVTGHGHPFNFRDICRDLASKWVVTVSGKMHPNDNKVKNSNTSALLGDDAVEAAVFLSKKSLSPPFWFECYGSWQVSCMWSLQGLHPAAWGKLFGTKGFGIYLLFILLLFWSEIHSQSIAFPPYFSCPQLFSIDNLVQEVFVTYVCQMHKLRKLCTVQVIHLWVIWSQHVSNCQWQPPSLMGNNQKPT